jgi:hypothetical protein
VAATDQRWRNGGGHGGPIDVEEAHYALRTMSQHIGLHRTVPFIGGGLGGLNGSSTRGATAHARRARGHVELLQHEAHELEAPREGLGGMWRFCSWKRTSERGATRRARGHR